MIASAASTSSKNVSGAAVVKGTISGLVKNTLYMVRAATVATSNNITSGWSNILKNAYTGAKPNKPVILAQTIWALKQVTLAWTWTDAGNATKATVKDYVVTYCKTTGGTYAAILPYSTTTKKTIIHITSSGLKTGETSPLFYKVAAANSVGSTESDAKSHEFKATALPPTNVGQAYMDTQSTPVALTVGVIRVTWDKSTSTGVVLYNIQSTNDPVSGSYATTGITLSGVFTVATPATANTVTWDGTGKVANKAQFFRLQSKDTVVGEWSIPKGLYHQWATAPTGSTMTQGKVYKADSVMVTWIAPTNASGSAISKYYVQFADNPQSTFAAVGSTKDAVTLSLEHKGTTVIKNSIIYYRVASYNGAGTGTYTAEPKGLVAAALPGLPGAIT